MKRSVFAAAILAAFGINLAAQGGAEKAQAEYDAAFLKGDKATHQRLLADDFIWVDQAGRLRDKKTVLDELRPPTGKATTEGIDVRPYPGGAVMIAMRKNPGGIDVRFLRLWVQQGNQWRLVAHQGTPISDTPVAAGTDPSSPMPPNSGPAADIKAIEQAIAALAAGNRKGDATNFGASVTDGFVAINTIGNVASKQDRMAQLAKRPDAAPPVMEEVRTRVYGDLAVTTAVINIAGGDNQPIFQTIIHAKQGGKWLRAGIIGTRITGKPSGQ